MLDTPIDAPYLWVGLSVAAAAMIGVAVELPRAPPPDADAAAHTLETVAASPHPAVAERELRAEEIRVGPRQVGLRSEAGTTHEDLAYPVTPVAGDGRLGRVLRGTDPADAFRSPADMARAAERARERSPEWRSAGRLLVRRVVWEDVSVTLAGVSS